MSGTHCIGDGEQTSRSGRASEQACHLLLGADWDTPISAADDTTDPAELARLQAEDAAYRAALRRFLSTFGLPGPPKMPWEDPIPAVPAHVPTEPQTIGLGRDLVYCARCGRLLSSAAGPAFGAEIDCKDVRVGPRRLAPAGSVRA